MPSKMRPADIAVVSTLVIVAILFLFAGTHRDALDDPSQHAPAVESAGASALLNGKDADDNGPPPGEEEEPELIELRHRAAEREARENGTPPPQSPSEPQ